MSPLRKSVLSARTVCRAIRAPLSAPVGGLRALCKKCAQIPIFIVPVFPHFFPLSALGAQQPCSRREPGVRRLERRARERIGGLRALCKKCAQIPIFTLPVFPHFFPLSALGARGQHGRSPTAWDEVLGPSVGPVPQARLAHRASKSVVLAKCCGIFRETTANFSSSGRATREPGGLGRRPTTRTRRRTPEDHATLPRRSTRAQTALPRRSRLVWRSARLNQKCTTR